MMRKKDYSVRKYNKLVKKDNRLTRKEFLTAYADDINRGVEIEIPLFITLSGKLEVLR